MTNTAAKIEKKEPGILMNTGHVIAITEMDYKRLAARLATGGNVEGVQSLDSGDVLVLHNICIILKDISILEK